MKPKYHTEEQMSTDRWRLVDSLLIVRLLLRRFDVCLLIHVHPVFLIYVCKL